MYVYASAKLDGGQVVRSLQCSNNLPKCLNYNVENKNGSSFSPSCWLLDQKLKIKNFIDPGWACSRFEKPGPAFYSGIVCSFLVWVVSHFGARRCTKDVSSGVGKLLQFVGTLKSLGSIRDAVWEILQEVWKIELMISPPAHYACRGKDSKPVGRPQEKKPLFWLIRKEHINFEERSVVGRKFENELLEVYRNIQLETTNYGAM